MATPTNQSVVKAFSILRCFNRPDEWMTSAELSRRAKLPEASGYRLLLTLEEIGAVVRGPRGRFRPGFLLVSLSRNVSVDNLMREVAQGVLIDVAKRVGHTVHMGVLEEGMVTYVAKIGDVSDITVKTQVGSQLEAYCSGLGKVLLAALPDPALDAFLEEGELVPLTNQTITDRIAFKKEIYAVRDLGFAIDNEEVAPGLRCVAVPVRDETGETVAAISASDHAARMDETRQILVREALIEAASEIGRRIYFQHVPRPALQYAR